MILPASVVALMLAGADPQAATLAPAIAPPAAAVPLPAAAQPAATPPAAPAPAAAQPAPGTQPAPGAPEEITVTARGPAPPEDPLQAINVGSFKAVQAVDGAVVAPIAKGYEKALPRPVRQGVHNVIFNLAEPVVFVNDLLQFKPGRAARTLARFVINTTVGIGGLFDVAKTRSINLPYRPNGFANTMGYYGVKPGAYLYLPLIGPTTVRDLTGRLLDLSFLPAVAGRPFNTPAYALANGVLKSLDDRVELDATLRHLREDTPDFYNAERAWYLQLRSAEIEALHSRRHRPGTAPATPAAAPAPAQAPPSAGAAEPAAAPPPAPSQAAVTATM